GVNTCPADLNNDGFIAIADILQFLGEFGCESQCTADIDGDGSVTVQDLLGGLLSAFGESCP
ncbi:MAG: GC-type dockerin domain-anchored protein, partial [Bacteroidota bacterium]|nr:GC-type dockerin domain-anchored protein [Bacteroidota bacterium]